MRDLLFRTPFPPADLSRIRDLEARCACPLPDDYRQYLLQAGGGAIRGFVTGSFTISRMAVVVLLCMAFAVYCRAKSPEMMCVGPLGCGGRMCRDG